MISSFGKAGMNTKIRTPPDRDREQLNKLKPFMREVRHATASKRDLFDFCLRAALAKAFDFAQVTFRRRSGGPPFMQIATLRGICEDLIVRICESGRRIGCADPFNELPAWQKRGVGLYWEAYEKTATDPRSGTTVAAIRRRIRKDMELPLGEAYGKFITELIESSGSRGEAQPR